VSSDSRAGATMMRVSGSIATVAIELVENESREAIDEMVRADAFRLELSVTPRAANARGCFTDSWDAHHFERLGDMVFVPRNHALHMRSDGRAATASIVCTFDGPFAERWLSHIEWTRQRLGAALDVASIAIRRIMRSLAQETRATGEDRCALIELLAAELAIELGRYFEPVEDQPVRGGLAPWRLRLIDERLKVEGPPPELAELARLCRVSIRQLMRGYRASRGCTIGDTIAHDRIETAKRLLRGAGSIQAIGQLIGFSNTSSFALAFRRATALTPNQYRQRILRANPPRDTDLVAR